MASLLRVCGRSTLSTVRSTVCRSVTTLPIPAAAPASVRAIPSIVLPVRAFHTSPLTLGGGGHHDDHHGHDFLPRENVERRVKMVLSEVDKIDKTKLKDLNSSFKSLGLDSLDEVEIVIMLEDEFVIDIQDEVASNILTIQDAINYISNHPFAANDEH